MTEKKCCVWIGRVEQLHPNDYDEVMEGSGSEDVDDVKHYEGVASFDRKKVNEWIEEKRKETEEWWEDREWMDDMFSSEITQLCEDDSMLQHFP